MAEEPTREELAAELALGLLDGTERAEALRLCMSDPGFAAEVDAWSLRLSPLLSGVPEVPAPPAVWRAVAARVGAGQEGPSARKLHLWRGVAIMSGAIAASLAFIVLTRPAEMQSPASVAISQLAGPGRTDTMAIAYDPNNGVLRLTPTSLGSAANGPELWVIPADGVPRSLGMIGPDGSELTVNEELRGFLKAGVTLAITMEDRSSAPHKAPTSQPILTGKISII